MSNGGFDVVVSNPPYVEYNKLKDDYTVKGFATARCGNLHAMFIEQSYLCLRQGGRFGMIVQLSYSCTDHTEPVHRLCLSQSGALWLSHFDNRPARLYDGLKHIGTTIPPSVKAANSVSSAFPTSYNRWYMGSRPQLFENMAFDSLPKVLATSVGAIPKTGPLSAPVIPNHIAEERSIRNNLAPSGNGTLYFRNAPQYWVRAMDFAPYFWNERDGERISTQVKTLNLHTVEDANAAVAGRTTRCSTGDSFCCATADA